MDGEMFDLCELEIIAIYGDNKTLVYRIECIG